MVIQLKRFNSKFDLNKKWIIFDEVSKTAFQSVSTQKQAKFLIKTWQHQADKACRNYLHFSFIRSGLVEVSEIK